MYIMLTFSVFYHQVCYVALFYQVFSGVYCIKCFISICLCVIVVNVTVKFLIQYFDIYYCYSVFAFGSVFTTEY